MTNFKLHDDYKILSKAAYVANTGKTINGWKRIKTKSYSDGYYAEAYQKGNQIVIVSRGTNFNSIYDLKNDLVMASGSLPSQFYSAEKFFNELRDTYGDKYKFVLTGHSLGGSISQALGAVTGLETVTFSAYGIGHIKYDRFKYSKNITNYGSKYDGIFMNNIDNQIGKTLILVEDKNNKYYATKSYTGIQINPNGKYMHLLENMEDLANSVEYKKFNNDINNKRTAPLLKGKVEENVYYDGKTYTPIKSQATGYAANITEDERQEIIDKYKDNEPFKGMSDNEIWNRYVNFEENKFFNPKNRVFYENEFNPAQAPKGSNDDIGIQEMIRQYYDNNKHLPPKDELDERVHTGELVYVHDYTRADGTKVSGYYRAYPN